MYKPLIKNENIDVFLVNLHAVAGSWNAIKSHTNSFEMMFVLQKLNNEKRNIYKESCQTKNVDAISK